MSKLILVGGVITVVLFIIGIILLTITDFFSDYWFIGITITAMAIVTIVVTIILKFKT